MKKPKLACFDNVPPEEVSYFWDELGKSVGEGVPRYDRNHKNIVVVDIAVIIWGDYHIPQVWELGTKEERKAFIQFQKNPGKAELVGRYTRGKDKAGLFKNVAEDLEFVMENRLKPSRFTPRKTPVPHEITWLDWYGYHNTHNPAMPAFQNADSMIDMDGTSRGYMRMEYFSHDYGRAV